MDPKDRVGTELLFENERVRVWDFVLGPDEETDFHSHENDYLFVYVTEDNQLDIHVPDGGVINQRSPEGFVAYWETGPQAPGHYTHKVHNVGGLPHRQILVELLGPSAGEEPKGPETNGR